MKPLLVIPRHGSPPPPGLLPTFSPPSSASYSPYCAIVYNELYVDYIILFDNIISYTYQKS